MRIATKINFALAVAFAAGTLVTQVVLSRTIQPKFDQIERQHALDNHERVTEAFHAATDKLKVAAQDYAFWDRLYDVMRSDDPAEFIKDNLDPPLQALQNLNIDLMVFLKADGSMMWGNAFNLESGEPIDGLVEETIAIAKTLPTGTDQRTTLTGAIHTTKGLMQVAISPVLKTDRSGDPAGHAIVARLIDQRALGDLTGVEFSLVEIQATPVDLPKGIDLTRGEKTIDVKSVMPDVRGKPLAILDVTSPRDVSFVGAKAIQSALVLMVGASLLAIGILWLFLKRQVSMRLVSLQKHMAEAGKKGALEQTETTKSADEIGDLARAFNAMTVQVNRLRAALADNAYHAGLSEWAAGTLHNVRNGLTPVTMSAWQVERLYDEAWLKNVQQATRELEEGSASPDRRAKLNLFLVSSSNKFVEAAKQTVQLSGKMASASKSVLDIVSDFERHAHKKAALEVVDVHAFVQEAVEVSLGADASKVRVMAPEAGQTVKTNPLILRQVLASLMRRSLNDVAHLGRDGRVDISFSTGLGEQSATLVAVTDNGKGLSPEALASFFKSHGEGNAKYNSGIDLHWCANAVNMIGGKIYVESPGVGQGSTVFISLPNSSAVKKEAA